MNYYGIRTKEEIASIVHEVAVLFSDGNEDLRKRSEALLNETLAAETRYGQEPDDTATYGIGIQQMEHIRFYDTMPKSIPKYRDLVFARFGIDLELLVLEHSRYDEVVGIICMRLAYKRIKAPIPDTRAGRAEYWKTHYNTSAGDGSVEHYITNSNLILGEADE